MSSLYRWRGKDGVTIADVEAENALRAARYTQPVGLAGAYSLSTVTGIVTAMTNGEVFHFRWTSSDRIALIRSVTITAGGVSVFSDGFGYLALVAARGWTVDGTGGTVVSMSGSDQEKRTDFAATAGPAVRIASTTFLGAGTKTLDTNPLSAIAYSIKAAIGTPWFSSVPLMSRVLTEDAPHVLFKDEGLVIRTSTSNSGSWTATVTVEWLELFHSDWL